MPGRHVAAIQADGQGRIGAGKLVPVALAALDERELFGSQLAEIECRPCPLGFPIPSG